MASLTQDTDLLIKRESPYPHSPPSYIPQSPRTPMKRQRSNQSDGSAEKRQRISREPDTSAELDFATLLARATATAHQEVAKAQGNGIGPAETVHPYTSLDNGQRSDAYTFDPQLHMRILSLPILESLSVQILATLASGNYNQAIDTVTRPESEHGQAYAALKSLFDQTKKLYSNDGSFLSPDNLHLRDPKHREILHKTNLATFLASVFSGTGASFYDLHDNFLDVFAPDGQYLQMEPADLFINLKTQLFVAAVTSNEPDVSPVDTIDSLFPRDLEADLVARHIGVPLSPNEHAYIHNANQRREYLSSMCHDMDNVELVSEEFTWEQFLLGISEYLNKLYDPICAPYLKHHNVPTSKSLPKQDPPQSFDQPAKSIEQDSLVSQAVSAANAAARQVLQSMGFGLFHNDNIQPQQPVDGLLSLTPQNSQSPRTKAGSDSNLPGMQSEPTAVLYERARTIAANKSITSARKPGTPSQRRPWSHEEEAALMTGLDQVKGPHWSQILALYGPNGTISDILKDRNQVQLKDKARNLKLFFLKSNCEVPHYLSQVTGELKTRAPSQAAKREMEDRQRLLNESQGSAKLETIMALSLGLQSQDRRGGSSSETPTPSPVSTRSFSAPEELQVVDPDQEELQRQNEIQRQREDEQQNETLRRELLAATMPRNEPMQYEGFDAVKM